MKIQDNYCNNSQLILDVKQLNKTIKLYYFHTLKTLWDGQGKIKMYYGMPKVKKQLSRKRAITKVCVSGVAVNNKMSNSHLESISTKISEMCDGSSCGFINNRNIQKVHL